jgi:hypothetical protein
MKQIMRLFFVLVPALIFAAIGGVIDYVLNTGLGFAAAGFVFAFLLGWDVTTPRPERGER